MIKGKGAEGLAIAYFSLKGIVSIPLHACHYNLIFDDGSKLSKIDVISTSYKNIHGSWEVSIKTMCASPTKTTRKIFDPSLCDYVFIVNSDLEMFNIPSKEIHSTTKLCLNMYLNCRVNFGDVV